MSSMWEIPFTSSLLFGLLQINVPIFSGSKVFLIRIGISFLKEGWIVGGYKTFAPKWDNSIASSYEISEIGYACFTTLGFAVNIPGTSVHICNSTAFKAAA